VQFTVTAIIIAVIVLVLVMSTIAYIIGARRFKQPFLNFLGRYIAIFGALLLIELAFLELMPSLHTALCNFTAAVVGGIIGLAGTEFTVSGSMITLQNPYTSFEVNAACLGGVLFWVYTALVFAKTGVTMRQRLVVLIAGLSVLVVFNIFRITLSIYLEKQTGVYVHDYFYLFNMAFVLAVWAAWARTLRVRAA